VTSAGQAATGGLGGEPGGLGRRLLALVIDWFACYAVALVLTGPAGFSSNGTALVTLAIFFVEVTLLTWLGSASFGQRILRLTVVRLGGGRLGLLRTAVRTLLICLVLPPLVMDSDGRGLQDRAVGSVVLRRA
jgi:uncharacterized RDD family membrane protein YckC